MIGGASPYVGATSPGLCRGSAVDTAEPDRRRQESLRRYSLDTTPVCTSQVSTAGLSLQLAEREQGERTEKKEQKRSTALQLEGAATRLFRLLAVSVSLFPSCNGPECLLLHIPEGRGGGGKEGERGTKTKWEKTQTNVASSAAWRGLTCLGFRV